MSIVTIGTPIGVNPSTYPCSIGLDSINIVVSSQTVSFLAENLQDYLQARALNSLLPSELESFVTPLSTGMLDTITTVDSRNWAQLWLDGVVLS